MEILQELSRFCSKNYGFQLRSSLKTNPSREILWFLMLKATEKPAFFVGKIPSPKNFGWKLAPSQPCEVLTTVSCPSAAAHAGYGAVYGGINAAGFSQAPSSQKSMGHVLLTYPSGGELSWVWEFIMDLSPFFIMLK